MMRNKPPAPTFEEVFDAEFHYVRRSLLRLGVRPADVEDLCQDVFLQVYRTFDAYDPARPIRPWLFAFAFRVASNHRRRMGTWRGEPSASPPERPTAGDPEALMADRQKTSRVLDALASLTLEKRSLLVMFDIDGFAAPEVADVLNIPINTVYSRVRKARAELRRSLQRFAMQSGEV